MGIQNNVDSINSFGSTVTLDTFNNRVFKHQVFGVAKRFDIPAGGTINIVIDPTENGIFPFDALVFLPFGISANGGGPVEIDLYIGTDSDPDGTKWEAVDRNFDGAVTPHTVVRLNPTINDAGILSPAEYIIESAAGQGSNADIGGSVKQDLIVVPTKTDAVLIRLINTDGSNAARGTFVIDWFEV